MCISTALATVQAFEVLAETELLAVPGRVVPSRQLPPQEPSDAQIPAGGATISWRGDGKYVATLSRTAPGGHRLHCLPVLLGLGATVSPPTS